MNVYLTAVLTGCLFFNLGQQFAGPQFQAGQPNLGFAGPQFGVGK